MSSTIVLDLTHGEAATVLAILTQRSEQTACPVTAKGSIIRGRPTINVTLKSPGTKDALRQEYNAGRFTCIKKHGKHDTEHFHFEWLAPREHTAAPNDGSAGDSSSGLYYPRVRG
ncbi:hypothetical protein DV737_g5441, partial [Chaetothyriales sp. CBS 132003]